MTIVKVFTSDGIIWNRDETVRQLSTTSGNIILDLQSEGPCIQSIGLDAMMMASPANISLHTSNFLEKAWPAIELRPPFHHVLTVRDKINNVEEKNIKRKFALLIGRSNTPRLLLSSQFQHLDILQTFHYDPSIEFHRANLGLESLISRYGINFIDSVVELLKKSPITLDTVNEYPLYFDKHLELLSYYSQFAIEIVCESYFTGETFFPTEKTWRPIAMKTPFIVQGPQNFLSNLKKMGFKTFDRWWDEGYSEDPADHQPLEIIKVVHQLNKISLTDLAIMHKEMHDVLEHNYQTFKKLKINDFMKVRDGQ